MLFPRLLLLNHPRLDIISKVWVMENRVGGIEWMYNVKRLGVLLVSLMLLSCGHCSNSDFVRQGDAKDLLLQSKGHVYKRKKMVFVERFCSIIKQYSAGPRMDGLLT